MANDFRAAQGTYVLATPTDAAANNETSGIWFLQPTAGGPRPSLRLPPLPAGWEYEGWVVVGGRPLTTGRFTSPNGPDGAAPYSGPMPGPPFPGEDFLFNAPGGFRFPLDLSGAMAVITIEPQPDDTPAPFSLVPLSGQVPSPAREFVDSSALFVYRGAGGEVLACQMYPGRLEQLPGADEVRTHRGFRFQIYRAESITLVFWQEADVVCVLAGDFGPEEVVGLALEKAML